MFINENGRNWLDKTKSTFDKRQALGDTVY
jgi:hypothetical protein